MEYAKKEIYDAKTDPVYQNPVIDVKEARTRQLLNGEIMEYLYIHGQFEGTHVKFIYCFPEKEQFQDRFFQHLSPFPGPDEELAALPKTGEDDMIAFCLSHGACYVESNMGSSQIFGTEQDPTIFYRSNAAAAEYCRTLAKELYGTERVIGIVFGGSGGGYKTMSCIENTNAYDGAVPYVIGSPMSLPNCLTIGTLAKRLLRNCWPKVVDACEPGGSGDIYANLNEEEQDALKEMVLMGVPPRVIAGFDTDDDGSLPVLTPGVHAMDPDYFTDFWNVPGYEGTIEGGSAQKDRICIHTRVVSAGFLDGNSSQGANAMDGRNGTDNRNGTDDAWQKMMTDIGSIYIQTEDLHISSDVYLKGVDIIFETGAAVGKKLRLNRIEGDKIIPGISYGMDDFQDVFSQVRPGDQILLDNSDYIAIQYYHRHQVPEDLSFHAWDQYRDSNGKPLCPQQKQVIAYGFTAGGCGSVQDGKIQGKVIVMNNLMDGDFPWQADWYRRKVEEIYGSDTDQIFRLWYNDNCPHGDVNEGGDPLRVVSYLGQLRQAILDVADWVQKGISPTPTTGYQIVDNQVILSVDAKERGGIQPMVTLLADGEECARVKAGESVSFEAILTMPPAAGQFVEAQFSFEGEPDYPYAPADVKEWTEDGLRRAVVKAEHAYQTPGTYFAVVRVKSGRDVRDGYTHLRNLCRARVIVE